jgi:hypothetical protein
MEASSEYGVHNPVRDAVGAEKHPMLQFGILYL